MGGIVFSAPCPSYHPLEYFGELLWVPRPESSRVEQGIPCLLLQRPEATHLALWFHANAEDLGMVRSYLKLVGSKLGVHVLAVEYPGYGICSGTSSEADVLQDADTVLDFVTKQLRVPEKQLLFMGRSMGGAPAIHLASRCRAAGLATISTFGSIRGVVANVVGFGFFFPNMFDNLRTIRSVRCPTLIIHGADDILVDPEQAQDLAANCGVDVEPRPSVTWHILDGMEHNYLPMEFWTPFFLEAFPDARRGPLLQLPATRWLRRQASWVTGDVATRVPYTRDCVPSGAHVASSVVVDEDT